MFGQTLPKLLLLGSLFAGAFSFATPVALPPRCGRLISGFAKIENPEITLKSGSPRASVAALRATSLAARASVVPRAVAASDPTETPATQSGTQGTLTALELGTEEVGAEVVESGLKAFYRFFEFVFGSGYAREPARNLDAISKELRSTLYFFDVADASIPSPLLRLIEKRNFKRQDRIRELKEEIGMLRAALSPYGSVEYLTPAALAGVRINKMIGNARNLTGLGVRDALDEVAAIQRHNVNQLFASMQMSSVFDDQLRDVLIMVAEAALKGRFNSPSADARVKSVCEELLVSSFSLSDPFLPPYIFQDIRTLALQLAGYDDDPDAATKLTEAINLLEKIQGEAQAHIQEFAEHYHEARIAKAELSIKTRPNGNPHILLGSPMRLTYVRPSEHQAAFEIAMRVYGGKKNYVSVSLGELIECPHTAAEVLGQEGGESSANRMLMAPFYSDELWFRAYSAGVEFELLQAKKLLEDEKWARIYSTGGQWLGMLLSPTVRRAMNNSRVVKEIMPGEWVSAMTNLVESGHVKKPEDKKKDVSEPPGTWVALPGALAKRLMALSIPKVWATLTAIGGLPESVVLPTAGELSAMQAIKVLLSPAAAAQAPADPAPPEGASGSSEDSQDALWQVLGFLDARARALMAQDFAIQLKAEVTQTKPDHKAIHQLSRAVKQLLDVALELQGRFYTGFREAGLRAVDAEYTLAWHILHLAPNLATYLVVGPPGAPNFNPPVTAAQAGLSWRVAMLAPVLVYGDGAPEPVRDPQNPVHQNGNPTVNRWLTLRNTGAMIAAAALSYPGVVGVQWGLQYMGVMDRNPPGVTQPKDPQSTEKPASEDEADPKPKVGL